MVWERQEPKQRRGGDDMEERLRFGDQIGSDNRLMETVSEKEKIIKKDYYYYYY